MQESHKNKQFSHFKVHTQYSICEGAVKIDELKDFCKKNKIQSLGISDTANLCGVLEFSEVVSKSGTQPIIGTQINFKFKNEIGLLTLIAKNKIGYKRIIELSSKSYLDRKETESACCQFDDLFEDNKNIILMSGTINGLFGKMFNNGKLIEIEEMYSRLSNSLSDNFYIEIQRHKDTNEDIFEKFNLNISNKLNIPLIASHEVFYLNKSMYEAHDALICIGNKTYVNEKKRLTFSNHHYFKSNEEMHEVFNDLPEALQNNFNLPFRCNFRPTTSEPILPNISSNQDGNAENKLKVDSFNGLKDKFKSILDKKNFEKRKSLQNKYEKRLNHELDIIIKMKYSSYFLIVADYIKWAKNNDIPVGPGRGSGAGSLVAWCLSITDVDPIKFNLIFERFLNPDRISMPDFDIDFCEEKRDKVFEYLSNKYKNSVAHIITFGKLKARMVIRDVGRVLGLSYGFIDSIAKMIPFDPSRPQSLNECINSEPRLQKLIKDDLRVKKLVNLSLMLEGLNRNIATHAAGVVIADQELTNTVPLYKDNSADLLLPSTQFDMYSAENAGLIKFDFLGLKTLTVINKTEKMIKEKIKNFSIKEIDYEDPEVFKMLATGNTVGLFQLESSGMKDALINMKPTDLEDIIALVALYRPGPMSNIPIYNNCKNGIREPDYIHPLLVDILKPTYGVIIYQEQVMQIAQKLSGFSAGEADILRKAIGKKKRAEVERQKERFIDGAVKNGIAKDVAAGIFLKIEPFAEYGFNKSHAAAYAIIAYQTAYLKTYYPNEFLAASMTMDISNHKKLSEFHEEIKRLKINIIRPNINESFEEFKFDGKYFYYALGAIKNVGIESVKNIINERITNGKFKSLNDFINRINPKDLNKLQLEGLTKAGVFDELFDNRATIIDSIPNIILKSKNTYENKLVNQKDLFEINHTNDKDYLNICDEWKTEEKLNKEFESLGFFMSDHPLNSYNELLDQFNIINYKKFIDTDKLKFANLAATVLKIIERKTNKGNPYAVIKFSDLSSSFEIFVFSEIFERSREFIKEGNSLLLEVSKQSSKEDNTNFRLNITNISSLKEIYKKPIDKVDFIIKNENQLDKLSETLKKSGNTTVRIKYHYNGKNYVLDLNEKREVNRESLKILKTEDISSIVR
tara:strand:- start:118 stop:3534 length:3417 start_codon:yes stop_codon:yes gene_type:complete